MKTVNRGWLKRQVAAGKVTMVGSYSFDDMRGETRTREETTLPVEIKTGDYKPGVVQVSEYEFKSSSGCAYRNDDGTVTMHVHSNSSYRFKIA